MRNVQCERESFHLSFECVSFFLFSFFSTSFRWCCRSAFGVSVSLALDLHGSHAQRAYGIRLFLLTGARSANALHLVKKNANYTQSTRWRPHIHIIYLLSRRNFILCSLARRPSIVAAGAAADVRFSKHAYIRYIFVRSFRVFYSSVCVSSTQRQHTATCSILNALLYYPH